MTVEVNDGLRMLGKWKRWQIIFYLILSVATTFPAAWHMFAISFIGGQREHRCILPEGAVVNQSIPYNDKGKLDSCSMYANVSDPGDNSTMSCPNGWEYLDDAGPTIVSEWNLVCDRSYLTETTQTVMVIGVMVGAMLFSALSDMFGRKPVFLFSQWTMVVVGVITAFVNNYYAFTALRFIAGGLQQGIILTGFVMACELFPAEQRTFAGMAIENFWAVGMCILALLAFLVRNWHYLQLTITLPAVLTIALFWLLPESVPWLVANGKSKQAEDIIKKAAKFNRVQVPEHIFTSPEQTHMLMSDAYVENSANDKKSKGGWLDRFRTKKKSEEPEEEKAAKYTLLDVLKHRVLRKNAIIMCLLWFVNSLVYYGLSLSTSALAGDRYLNFFLSGLVEIPAYTGAIFILQKWGRRWPLAIFHIIAGVALVITQIIPPKLPNGKSLVPLIMVFNMIGKFGITGSFGTVFLYAPEIFPTTLRNQAMGLSSLGGRLGNMLAPFSSFVARIVPWLPGVLFGGLSILVGLLVLLLPETLGRPLPQTIEDIEEWERAGKRKGRSKGKHELAEMGNDTKNVDPTST